ncbi:hypothetical protein RD055328_03650 [Companilactobacillus sp. RD055328]|uniref:zinc ribbon domain-containing protein n=1 Tax=Companilactobacillus sp. RD055328 TaxID=2916634 RepID=UPI001FC7BDF9|nr:zinc ribbon domain-containing protein [Companilactobacillus sp. RD055328]GKQ42442.1 hypothetical protein RD055328_03650 [Companilactobacillus sp. RD055328]
MICPNCHETIPVNSKFCPNCGIELTMKNEYEKREENPLNSRRSMEHQNVFLAYAKNNFLLLLISLVIIAILFYFKTVVGIIALALVLMTYYLRATATNGKKEGASKKIEQRLSKSTEPIVNTNQEVGTQPSYSQPVRRRFNSISNVIILLISAAVTLMANFFGNFIQIDAQAANFDTSTPMTLYQALNLGGIAAKFTNVLNIQIDIQGILTAVFYILVALPALVILLTFFGGRFSRFVLSLMAFAAYLGAIVYLYYETTQLQLIGITLGLTPGIMFYVAILSSFVMLIFSTKVRK